ncbi:MULTISPECIES: hypothetical protein [Streptomyces]|uniref:hypothetical protein n=1 Tax=Streptomyces TaxID=1883 RepID=UPI0021A6B95D|nr:hypothetical protein [Streptomyces atratus]MCT2548179.1 hypothetical protein [Streptomyces atratus]
MTEAWRDELDTVDPGWCPVWDTEWRRCFRLVQKHVQADAMLPEAAGDNVVVEPGTWLDNTDRLTERRRADLDTLDMRW